MLASEQPASEQYAVRPMHADPVFGLRDFLQRLLLVWLNSYPSGFHNRQDHKLHDVACCDGRCLPCCTHYETRTCTDASSSEPPLARRFSAIHVQNIGGSHSRACSPQK